MVNTSRDLLETEHSEPLMRTGSLPLYQERLGVQNTPIPERELECALGCAA